LKYNEFYDAIDEIRSFLSRDLIGSIAEEEVIEDIEPLSYYTMGILWTKRLGDSSDEQSEQMSLLDIEDSDIEDTVNTDVDVISRANSYKPPTMGVSVMLPANAESLNVDFSFGKYTLSQEEQFDEEGNKKKTINRYTRKPYKISTVFTISDNCGVSQCTEHEEFHELGVDLSLCVRRIIADGSKLVTVSVTNAVESPQKSKPQNENALFQCNLHLHLDVGFNPIFQNNTFNSSVEEQIGAMQYREVLNYATGHGCSVKYGNSTLITDIYSDFMPTERVSQMKPCVTAEKDILRLLYWETAEQSESCERLLSFISEYAVWRQSQAALAITLDEQYQTAANAVLSQIEKCINRLKAGVEVLRTDNHAWKSFKLMNAAMLLQRKNTKKLNNDELSKVEWYPFQLAYILQIIPDIAKEDNEFRNVVDLLWFPTGGGKTEAYLGVAAFAVFYRRLSNKPINDGVTIIMRYTLRLLTIQQFERASALICACECLRKQHRISGGEISIGLWIGSGMTPNRIEGEGGAAEILEQIKKDPDNRIVTGNPVQITNCPWCGEVIDLDGYDIVNGGLVIRCNRNKSCEFHNSLPIYLVDEDVYRVRPTLLLSTIDKFARLAWEIDSKSLFGDSKCMPPELIIQDELHLISGALGSLAGIYEIGVEYLCSRNGKYPKVIASTATVKNANEQIRNIYNKKAFQFPPSGMSFDDSFFAIKASDSDRPARTYVGLCETGGSLADLMIRVYANLMFIKALFIKQGKPEHVIDQYATIIGYFNAIRDLGGADNIINDRVYSYIRTLISHKFKEDSENVGLVISDIRIGNHDELTSRKTSKEIKETLTKLDTKYTEDWNYSYVLASNMLSVGIDINRLGVMTMYNQPKSNAEYIQATSRVGRQNPGLVLSMYNGSRSRDKSHYEQFKFYHNSFYQYVEATSVTPFSARAIEKAVHCVFIIMLRLTESSLGANDYAVNFDANADYVEKAKQFILDRVRDIYPNGISDAKEWLESIVDAWVELADDNPNTLVYKAPNNSKKFSLLVSGEQQEGIDFPAILNSLRNVESSSNVFIGERD
jgi:hypothetical protein